MSISEEQVKRYRRDVEHAAIDAEDKMFEEFERLRKKWDLAEGVMADLVRSYAAELGDHYFDWLEDGL